MNKNSEKFTTIEKYYWQYYLQLEQELLAIKKYVTFEYANGNTYSIEFLKIYQAVCSEIDVIGKVIAHELDNNFRIEDKQNNIQKWWLIIQPWFSSACDEKEIFFYHSYKLNPWDNYEVESYRNRRGATCIRLKNNAATPSWWSAYNRVKHNRTSLDRNRNELNYVKANLWNVSNAFAALYLLEKTYLSDIGTKDEVAMLEHSRLFENEDKPLVADREEAMAYMNLES